MSVKINLKLSEDTKALIAGMPPDWVDVVIRGVFVKKFRKEVRGHGGVHRFSWADRSRPNVEEGALWLAAKDDYFADGIWQSDVLVLSDAEYFQSGGKIDYVGTLDQ